MIKICHFTNQITGKSDGVFNHLCSIFITTDRTKYKHILIFQGGESVERKLNELNIAYYCVETLNRTYSLKTFYDIFRIIKKENPDILHTHLIKPYTIVGLINIFIKKKMVFNYHGLFINNVYNSTFQKIIYKVCHLLITKFNSVSLVIVPSVSSKKNLLNETQRFKEIKTYYNSYLPFPGDQKNHNISDEIKLFKNKYFLIGIVARIERQKRIDKSLEILLRLLEQRQSVFFVYFGDGPLEEEMKNLAIRLEIERYCKFYGFVENASHFMKYFDLMIITSDWEGFPLAIWEAMSNGIPILSSDVGGIKEIIETENCGIIFNKNELSLATKKIVDLIENPERLRALGLNGKVAIKTKYSIENFTKSIEKFYTELYEN